MKAKSTFVLLLVGMLASAQVLFAQEIKLLRNLSSLLDNSDYRIMESVEMGGRLYFSTWSSRGTELWYTDGNVTAAIYEWPYYSDIKHDYALNKLYVLNNHLLFTGIDSAHGKELWTSDGTTAGTYMLKDICPGTVWAFGEMKRSNSYNSENILYTPFTELNGKMYFIAVDSSFRNDIWESDGTEAGTRRLVLMSPYPESGLGAQVGIYNSMFYFAASPTPQDFGMYISDGTVASTSELVHALIFQDYFLYSGKLFFNRSGRRGFGTSDGTPAGTFFIDPNIACSADKVVFNNRLYFFNARNFNQLYTTDGTITGTWKVKDTLTSSGDFPPNLLSLTIHGRYPTVYGNSIYFCNASALWKSDGTYGGTVIVKNLRVDANAQELITAGNRLYFKAWDSIRLELFVSDGTTAGTYKIVQSKANYVDIDGTISPKYPNEKMMVYKNQLFFTAIYDTAIGKALYKIDLPTGINNQPKTIGALVIAPNPTPGLLSIRYPQDAYTSATVYDAIGRTAYTQSVATQGRDALNLAHLAPGHYFIRLSGTAPSISAPVVIER